jgi:hypothetical protein
MKTKVAGQTMLRAAFRSIFHDLTKDEAASGLQAAVRGAFHLA